MTHLTSRGAQSAAAVVAGYTCAGPAHNPTLIGTRLRQGRPTDSATGKYLASAA